VNGRRAWKWVADSAANSNQRSDKHFTSTVA
jgi:hypothetical protein